MKYITRMKNESLCPYWIVRHPDKKHRTFADLVYGSRSVSLMAAKAWRDGSANKVVSTRTARYRTKAHSNTGHMGVHRCDRKCRPSAYFVVSWTESVEGIRVGREKRFRIVGEESKVLKEAIAYRKKMEEIHYTGPL